MTSIAHVRDRLIARRIAGAPLLVGVTEAPVAAGKSTFAAELAEALRAEGLTADIVCTDGFLMPNARLEGLGILNRKGFPESFDTAALRAAPGRGPRRARRRAGLIPM